MSQHTNRSKRVRLSVKSGLLALLLAMGLLAMGLAGAAAAAAPKPVALTLTPKDQADVARVEQYMDGIHTLRGRFQQYASDGSTADGKVYLSRPGKMRFEYAPPNQLRIVANGDYVAYDDRELNQISYAPVEATPAWFLLRSSLKLSGDVTITKFEHGPGVLRITVVETASPDSGSITLVFSDQPLTLRQWSIVDQQGRTTTVALADTETGVPLSSDLFILPANQPKKSGPEIR
ncbi:MAG TPA: outer membrane lipoprotein carrier protein LolA [Stellaceae bacterium]|nr:outer membrane lipoprotein carrier protein LolA [Stellaceae bacterium]